MSLFSAFQDLARRSPLTTGRALVACVVASGLLVGCGESGFRPLNGAVGIGANAEVKLSSVDIAPIPGRLGQRLRNELIFGTTGGGAPTTEPAYRLEIAVTESVASTLVKTDGDSASQIYAADARFNLIRLSDKKVVLTGVSFGRAGLERNASIFSNTRAQDDAQNRAARTIANELKTRVASFLATST
jgi:LPS-assembly lipoprotein